VFRAGDMGPTENFDDHARWEQCGWTTDHVLYPYETGRYLGVGGYEVQQMVEVPADEASRAAGWRGVPRQIAASGHGPGQPD
jgi:hypothetical protein